MKLRMNRLEPSKAARAGILLILVIGCASLPRLERWAADVPPNRLPRIVASYCPLSEEETRALLIKLEREAGSTAILQRHMTMMEKISGMPFVAGNEVTLLVDGPATFSAMFEAIEKAKDHVNLETYIFDDDELGQQFADLLIRKRAEGVPVHLIYDSIGSRRTRPSFFERLRESGIQVLEFHPLNPLEPGPVWASINRDHRKILVVDGSIAFTGGVNFSAVYSRSFFGSRLRRQQKRSWRDTHIQIEGPAVRDFQNLFFETWTRQKGPPLPPKNYFPPLEKKGRELVQVIASSPGDKNYFTYLMYLSGITFATKSIHLTSAYFVPDDQIMSALKEAAQRGVDVRIILPSSSDIGLVLNAGRAHYTELLEAGVKIFEHRAGMLHAKTAVVDGIWSTVGSTNMELWSFLRNDEINAVVVGADFAARMELLFQEDLRTSDPIDPEEWRKRPISRRLAEWTSQLLRYWL